MKLLIADDEPYIGQTLSALVEDWGYEAVLAEDGETALKILENPDGPNIALLDWIMPGIDGIEICKRLAARKDTRGMVYTVLLTARREREDKIAALDAGAHDFLSKPVDEGELKSRLAVGARLLAFERALIEKNRQVLHAQKLESLGILAGGIAHDFNNLLAGILGNASMVLYDLEDDHPSRGYLQSIIKASTRAAELASQMLAYAGHGRYIVKSIALAPFVERLRPLLLPSLGDKIELTLDIPDSLPPLLADPEQLRQVFVNLVSNARDAIGDEQGEVSIHARLDEIPRSFREAGLDTASKPGMRIDISDSGCGMDPAILAKVFEPFYSTKFIGRGLGLAAVAGIMRSHGGGIEAKSKPGKGSVFTLYFPLSTAE